MPAVLGVEAQRDILQIKLDRVHLQGIDRHRRQREMHVTDFVDHLDVVRAARRQSVCNDGVGVRALTHDELAGHASDLDPVVVDPGIDHDVVPSGLVHRPQLDHHALRRGVQADVDRGRQRIVREAEVQRLGGLSVPYPFAGEHGMNDHGIKSFKVGDRPVTPLVMGVRHANQRRIHPRDQYRHDARHH